MYIPSEEDYDIFGPHIYRFLVALQFLSYMIFPIFPWLLQTLMVIDALAKMAMLENN